MTVFAGEQEARLRALAHRLLDPDTARVAIEPLHPGPGHWFGGGNVLEEGDGTLYLTGRYRNPGDSRTGVDAGERGRELALWRSTDQGQHWEKILSFEKSRLSVGTRRIISIEGSALVRNSGGVELFVSSEKTGVGYGHGLDEFLKPCTGVWSIERLSAPSVEALAESEPVTALECADPRYVHVKDPCAYRTRNGSLALVFCTHPFSWSSSNNAYALRRGDEARFELPVFDFFSRGTTWDVAIARMTALLDVPRVGAFSDLDVTLVFYDGGESMRNLDEHVGSVSRPRGYSCEELGGLAYFTDGGLHSIERISRYLPEFVSNEGSGCNRYVDIARVRGGYLATWQRSRADRAQPLMSNFVSEEEVASLLA